MATTRFMTRNMTRKQYETALWFVRKLYRATGLQSSASEHVHFYHGFQDVANRDSAKYPEYISPLTFAIALETWQHNPNKEG